MHHCQIQICTITLFYLSTNCVLSVFIKRILELELEFNAIFGVLTILCKLEYLIALTCKLCTLF